MSEAVVDMADTIGANSSDIPRTFKVIGGYVTGTSEIRWDAAEWAEFPDAVHVRIEQGFGALLNPGDYDEIDVEAGAISPQIAAGMIAARVAAGYEWTTVYATRSNLALVASAVQAHGEAVWVGHVNCMLADWNLDRAEAAALVGTSVEGMTCVGVQWASPSSNPDSLVPGDTKTLRESNIDLSVVAEGWTPSTLAPPTPPAPPVEPAETDGIVVYFVGNAPVSHAVTSTDLHTWQ